MVSPRCHVMQHRKQCRYLLSKRNKNELNGLMVLIDVSFTFFFLFVYIFPTDFTQRNKSKSKKSILRHDDTSDINFFICNMIYRI